MSSAPTTHTSRWRIGHGWIPFAVLAAIAVFVLLPVRGQLFPDPDPPRARRAQGAGARSTIPTAATWPAESSPSVRTLVLYDTGARWGWLGEVYATQTTNLVSHFGRWEAKPARRYRSGDIDRYSALIYLGSTYDEPLPAALLDDVLRTRPVIWVNDNILQLTDGQAISPRGTAGSTVRWDRSRIAEVRYKGTSLTRWSQSGRRDHVCRIADKGPARVGAPCVERRARPPLGRSLEESHVLAEQPFTYMSETDRVLVFADSAVRPARAADARTAPRARAPRGHQSAQRPRGAAGHCRLSPLRRDPVRLRRGPYYRDPRATTTGAPIERSCMTRRRSSRHCAT